MGRSLVFSSLLHLAILSCMLMFSLESPAHAPQDQAQIIIRPLKVAERPKLPQIDPGLPIPEALPSSRQDPPEPTPLAAEKVARPAPALAQVKDPPKKDPANSPQLLLPEPNYPTRPSNERSMSAEGQETASGSGPIRALGEDQGEDRPALPYYHPAVTLTGMSDRSFILVKFEIEANARFEVEILEGTGNIHHDARALHVLKRWKWLPMRINGENLASVEIVRLFRKDTPLSEARH